MTITEGIVEGVLLKAGDVVFMATHGIVKKYVVTAVIIGIRQRRGKYGVKQTAVEASKTDLSEVR